MGRRIRSAIVLLALFPWNAAAADAADFKVIVNTANTMDSISTNDLSRLFLKKDSEWPDGTPVVAVDLDAESPTREAFSLAVHGRKVSSIQSYWHRQIFAGKAVPPVERSNQAEVIVYVSRHRDAIAYVTSAAPLVDNVKVLEITE